MNRFYREYMQMKGSHALEREQQPESAPVAPEPEVPLPSPPARFDGPLPSSSQIMDKLTGFMRRFLVCSDDQLTVLALWVLHTWCHTAFHVTPCLNVCSAERRTGKTTCLQLLRRLCPVTWYAVAPAPSIVIKTLLLGRSAVLLDDRQRIFSAFGGQQQVLNCLACASINDELYFASDPESSVKGHNVFNPVALAGRGMLPPFLDDRSIPISLRPAKPSSVKPVRLLSDQPDYRPLMHLLQCWATENVKTLMAADLGRSRDDLTCLNAHQQDHVGPLLMLADLIGAGWPEKTRLALSRIFRAAANDTISLSIQLLYDIRQAFQGKDDPARLSTSYLVDYLSRLPGRPWEEWNDGKSINGRSLALLLERFDIAPDKQRTGSHDGSVRGYNRNSFLPAWQQYFDDLQDAGCSASASTGTNRNSATSSRLGT